MTRVTHDGSFDDVEELRKRFELRSLGTSMRRGRDCRKSYSGLPLRSRTAQPIFAFNLRTDTSPLTLLVPSSAAFCLFTTPVTTCRNHFALAGSMPYTERIRR